MIQITRTLDYSKFNVTKSGQIVKQSLAEDFEGFSFLLSTFYLPQIGQFMVIEFLQSKPQERVSVRFSRPSADKLIVNMECDIEDTEDGEIESMLNIYLDKMIERACTCFNNRQNDAFYKEEHLEINLKYLKYT